MLLLPQHIGRWVHRRGSSDTKLKGWKVSLSPNMESVHLRFYDNDFAFAFRRERGNAKACCRDCNRGKADMDAVQFQRFRGWIPRCQNIVDEYDCENDAISMMIVLLFELNKC